MTRTENQRKGDAAENMAIVEAVMWQGRTAKRGRANNPGSDFESVSHGGCFIS